MIKPQRLSGFRDFLPLQKRQRDFVLRKVIEVFERFGFEPLETPTLETSALLLGKYGTEADKLVYTFKDRGGREIGLRFDQTVPTARVLVEYRQQLPKYFRRYQIQNVFRAEKPQRARYREFTQCDIDIFGSTDPVSDAEIVACTYFAFKGVGYPKIILKLNDRQILFKNLKPFASDSISIFSIIQSIDKLDKIPASEVLEELNHKGLPEDKAKQVLFNIQTAAMSDSLQTIIDYTTALGVPEAVLQFSPALARGLDYYTGMIFEVSVPEFGTNSLGGGGRYDELIENLGGVSIPAVGIAFGFDRMVEAAMQLELISTEMLGTQVLVTVFDNAMLSSSLSLTQTLRQANIATEIFPGTTEKLDKQLKYADKKGIPYVVIIGPEEVAQNKVKLKDMRNRTEEMLNADELVKKLK